MQIIGVIELFRTWQQLGAHTCKCKSHYDEQNVKLPDEKVCLREQAWRRYTAARDRQIVVVEATSGKIPSKITFDLLYDAIQEVNIFEALEKK